MDFKELCNARKRMCDRYSCDRCPIFSNYKKDYILNCCEYIMNYPEEVEEIIDKWNKENPTITNADKFKEVFGYEINSSNDHEGYFYLFTNDNNKRVRFIEHIDQAETWLKLEYKDPSQK